ncbi:tRNA pseudouridine(55) synthase TruB [Caproiciproducens faecalis]|uniref:tRNA pseudouridine synthase B n=1 Tax=Caproiciproducens faecalis TaxID=2820301 RepID=A0ABS7DP18_9FIRM|nr:tRNA pseudouridine(55) synthase TruB [Caproiciproducens faecalis]MBW7572864.1 tRNA pseudouridine(55) synthase TruB [Caproiciproducens faecalis]
MNGVIVIDKPQDFTSFDVVAVMRRLCGQKKIGHTGTLDPMATGVLPLLLGKATRAAALLDDTDKEYRAGFQLGYCTDTQDTTGKKLQECGEKVPKSQIEAVLPYFRGNIWQIPPMYSAVQKNGQRLYTLARQGIEVERDKRPVTIYELVLNEFDENTQSGVLTVRCSAGTYIRTLCADIGEKLGTFGVMSSLRRTRAAGFSLEDAVSLDEAKLLSEQGTLEQKVRPTESLFYTRPALQVTAAQARRFQNGGALSLERLSALPRDRADGSTLRVLSPDGVFLGLGAVDGEKAELSVLRLFCETGTDF